MKREWYGKKHTFHRRDAWAHKGEFGKVLVVGGSIVHSGSPAFNALSALRAGADLTLVVAPRRAADIIASFAPDLITYALDSEIQSKHVPTILSLTKEHDALVIGGGAARAPATYRALARIITRASLPMVIDAEAIRAVAVRPAVVRGKRAVLTPHADEFRALTGEQAKPNVEDRKKKVKKWARRLGVVIVFKGHIDVISDGRRVALNRTGSPYMTKGGFGDTLAGICGALLARGTAPLEAAYRAAYINGRAAENLLAKNTGKECSRATYSTLSPAHSEVGYLKPVARIYNATAK